MKITEICFESDGFRLKGVLHTPSVTTSPLIVGSHGLFATSQSPKQIALANACVEKGMSFFRFDHRGCGDSDGIFSQVTSLESRCQDLLDAVKYLQHRDLVSHGLGLFGSSLGAATCLSVFQELSPSALVINAAPVKSDPVSKSLEAPASQDLPTLQKNLRFDITPVLPKQHHILVFHGDSDELVPVSDGKFIHENANEPKRLVILEGGDHAMNNPNHQKIFITESARWFQTYLMKQNPF